ncbi:hypothetical protein SDC9_170199 [bioreactor metagenome]|uniref:Uncharacterized protein n=1 Tax=bioreactor metagenome TaxID=1076179 RepID=A0A645G859_9ZZZZ
MQCACHHGYPDTRKPIRPVTHDPYKPVYVVQCKTAGVHTCHWGVVPSQFGSRTFSGLCHRDVICSNFFSDFQEDNFQKNRGPLCYGIASISHADSSCNIQAYVVQGFTISEKNGWDYSFGIGSHLGAWLFSTQFRNFG